MIIGYDKIYGGHKLRRFVFGGYLLWSGYSDTTYLKEEDYTHGLVHNSQYKDFLGFETKFKWVGTPDMDNHYGYGGKFELKNLSAISTYTHSVGVLQGYGNRVENYERMSYHLPINQIEIGMWTVFSSNYFENVSPHLKFYTEGGILGGKNFGMSNKSLFNEAHTMKWVSEKRQNNQSYSTASAFVDGELIYKYKDEGPILYHDIDPYFYDIVPKVEIGITPTSGNFSGYTYGEIRTFDNLSDAYNWGRSSI